MRVAFALYGRLAGVIERSGGRMTLQYTDEYTQWRNATPLSLSLPVSETVATKRPVEAYLKGLLPDRDEVRARWASKAGVRPGDTLGLVAHVGLDVSGGAVFAPEDAIGDALARPGTYETADDAAIAARLRRFRQDEAAWQDDEDEEPWSLAGAQSKFTLARTEQGWAFPEGSAPSTHIVKPGIGRIPGQALLEHLTMRALAIAGLTVAQTQHLTFEDQAAVVVTRFDRRATPDGILRVHQEDLLQAFALDPRRKYESDGGPGVRQVADLLRSVADAQSLERFVRAVIANQVLGAPDAHGKNYGLLLVAKTVSLAPLYDVATGLVPAADGRLRWTRGAMSVGGERYFGDVERPHWERFAHAAGVPAPRVLDWVAELAETLPAAFDSAVAESDADEADEVASRTAPLIAAVAQQTLAGLTSTRRSGGRLTTPFVKTLTLDTPAADVAGTSAREAPEEHWDT